jgi:ADP-dependent NAD(P)H-hydrate dehydratase / NAD(P)H-hydrate epimerase
MALPVLTVAEMRAWEQASWEAGIQPGGVIAQVGERLASEILRTTPGDARILILAGPGNNGNDARATVPHLTSRRVQLVNVSDPVSALPLVARGIAEHPALIVDGLFGIGLNRDLSPEWESLIGILNGAGIPIASIDVPSGLNAETGCPMGAAVQAQVTYTVGAPKLGMLQSGASLFVGRLEVLESVGLLGKVPGIPEEMADSHSRCYWTGASDFRGFPRARPRESHKGDYGHLVIIAGSHGYHGAAVLAARAALRARPGLITVITSPEVYLPVASQLAAPMVRRWTFPLELPPRTTAVLFGPGLAGEEVPPELQETLTLWWKSLEIPMIADASALDWLAVHRPEPGQLRVWTPHPGEAGRLLAISAARVNQDRVGAARTLSANVWTVLKGHQTTVSGPGSPLYFNSTGNPGLAQGGSGDVLGGYLGGLIAQPHLAAQPCTTIRYAVWSHGRAADRLESIRSSWSSEDLIDSLG